MTSGVDIYPVYADAHTQVPQNWLIAHRPVTMRLTMLPVFTSCIDAACAGLYIKVCWVTAVSVCQPLGGKQTRRRHSNIQGSIGVNSAGRLHCRLCHQSRASTSACCSAQTGSPV